VSVLWEELTEGQRLEPESVGPITRTDVVRYQGASGDMNPVHHDEPFARAAGYPAPLVVGMFQAGVLCAWAARRFGPENLRLARMRWQEPVFPGDVLELEGAITRKYLENSERRIDVELVCKRRGGGVAVTAWETFVVEAEPGSALEGGTS
jgi:acyl dehydratase